MDWQLHDISSELHGIADKLDKVCARAARWKPACSQWQSVYEDAEFEIDHLRRIADDLLHQAELRRIEAHARATAVEARADS